MITNTFEREFQRRIKNIKDRAIKAGTTITGLCEITKIARATPDRWVARTPKTVKLIDKLDEALREIESKKHR